MRDVRGHLQQDALSSNLILPELPRVLAVFDGRGRDGGRLAERAVIALERVSITATPDITVDELTSNAADAMTALDERLRHDPAGRWSGVTAAIALFKNNSLNTLSVGENKGIFLPDGGERVTVIAPHDASDPDELQRMVERGHPISKVPESTRSAYGALAVSRSIGDHGSPWLSSEIEQRKFTLRRPGWLVLGTDGLWGHTEESQTAIEAQVRDSDGDIHRLARDLVLRAQGLHDDDASVVLARIE